MSPFRRGEWGGVGRTPGLPRFARNYGKNRKKSSGFPAPDRIGRVPGIRPFTNKFSFARMLSITDLVEFAAFFNKLAHERDFENAELSGGGSLGSR